MNDRADIDESLRWLRNQWRYYASYPAVQAAYASAIDCIAALRSERDVCREIAALALDGQTPQDGYWYAPDENGDPHYLNDQVTPEQQAELDAIRRANGVEE